ncbi:hypothetical protein [Fodinicurvata sediminis]|uniref:hypothetical protein n=1 Tax=Fodinicurvata sediminis TaxID=1121832 RepID=UPI0003B77409|nr:hypothetical protein [Fodinicurvata sediminis]
MKSVKLTILPATLAGLMATGIAFAQPGSMSEDTMLLAQNQETSRESGPASAEEMKQDEDPALDTMSNNPDTDHNDVGGQPEGTSIEGAEDIDGDDSNNNAAMGSTPSVSDKDLVDEEKDENITE